jgi:cell division protein FtsZ
MKNMGDAIMGSGIASGDEKATFAAQQAINSPLLQNSSIKGAKGLLVNVTGPKDMTMRELTSASNIIYEEAGEDANVILGCVIDPELTDEIRITVIATGLNSENHPEFHDLYTDDEIKNKYLLHSTSVEDLEIDKHQMLNEEKNSNNEEEKKENIVKNETIMKFGDDLDIPTFLRNRKI